MKSDFCTPNLQFNNKKGTMKTPFLPYLNPTQFDCDVERDINFFQVDLYCYSNTCNKVEVAFNDAGNEISKVLKLKRTIYVTATFMNLSDDNVLDPTQTISLVSDDDNTRLYPRALVSDNEIIKPDQIDFYAVVLHEFIHGLGFLLTWGNSLETTDYQPTDLTSDFYYDNNKFNGFIENIFDRYVRFIRNNFVYSSSSFTIQLNKAVPIGASFNSYSKFVTEVKSSSQWEYAKSALISATTNDLNTNFGITLEELIELPISTISTIPRILFILESIGYPN
ncbi:hypothetical protein Glove_55g55 [Diversispora epigaea]|uniref:Uncharacterized protein n=1 Tax=Diversispora epigaea TaxID=1348612 RepID=A0A397JLJ5_9GLOM|nr:hypothetical protein Glove_55g55 [Diversispora epigaea]